MNLTTTKNFGYNILEMGTVSWSLAPKPPHFAPINSTYHSFAPGAERHLHGLGQEWRGPWGMFDRGSVIYGCFHGDNAVIIIL